MKLTLTAMFFLTLLWWSAISADTAEPAIPALRTDIEFAKVGDVSLTLDAFVPEGAGPFPTCILVHGGGFVREDMPSYIKPSLTKFRTNRKIFRKFFPNLVRLR